MAEIFATNSQWHRRLQNELEEADMTPKLLIVTLALAAGLAGCAATPEYRTTYYSDGYYSYRYYDRDAYRDRYHNRYVYRDYNRYSYNRWDPYGIDSHQTN
jgi:hypothetical protein